MAEDILAAGHELRTYTTQEVSEMTGISRTQICRAVANGKLHTASTGRRHRYRLSEVERWLSQNEGSDR